MIVKLWIEFAPRIKRKGMRKTKIQMMNSGIGNSSHAAALPVAADQSCQFLTRGGAAAHVATLKQVLATPRNIPAFT